MSESTMQRLLDLAASKASGDLVCEDSGAEVHVYLQGGRLAWATLSGQPLSFIQHLKKDANVDEASLQAVLDESRRSGAPLSETLVSWNLATHDQVRAALRHQIGPALSMVRLSTPGAKHVFLARPKYANYSDELTFSIQDLLGDQFAEAQVDGAPASAPTGASGQASASAPAPAPASTPTAASTSTSPAVSARSPRPRLTPVGTTTAQRKQQPPSSRKTAATVAGVVILCGAIAGVVTMSRTRSGDSATQAQEQEGSAPAAPPATDEVLFGMAGSFSGPGKDLARSMRIGIETALAVANEKGGIHGRRLRLVGLDDQYSAARALPVMQELVETRKVFAMVGNTGAASAAVALPYVAEKKILFFGALSGSSVLRRTPPDRYVFNYRPSYAEESAAALRYLINVRRLTPSQIGVVYQEDDLGVTGVAGIDEQLRRMKQDPAQLVKIGYKVTSPEIAGTVARLSAERARLRAVIIAGVYAYAGPFIQQMRDAGNGVIFVGLSSIDPNALAETLVSAGSGYTSDVVMIETVPMPTSKATAAIEFQNALQRHAPGEKPGFASFEGYIVGTILVDGMRRAGRDLSTESLVTALEGIRDLDLGTGAPISFSQGDHQASHKLWGMTLQPDGSYRSIRLD